MPDQRIHSQPVIHPFCFRVPFLSSRNSCIRLLCWQPQDFLSALSAYRSTNSPKPSSRYSASASAWTDVATVTSQRDSTASEPSLVGIRIHPATATWPENPSTRRSPSLNGKRNEITSPTTGTIDSSNAPLSLPNALGSQVKIEKSSEIFTAASSVSYEKKQSVADRLPTAGTVDKNVRIQKTPVILPNHIEILEMPDTRPKTPHHQVSRFVPRQFWLSCPVDLQHWPPPFGRLPFQDQKDQIRRRNRRPGFNFRQHSVQCTIG